MLEDFRNQAEFHYDGELPIKNLKRLTKKRPHDDDPEEQSETIYGCSIGHGRRPCERANGRGDGADVGVRDARVGHNPSQDSGDHDDNNGGEQGTVPIKPSRRALNSLAKDGRSSERRMA
jgi:hypothetical protein